MLRFYKIFLILGVFILNTKNAIAQTCILQLNGDTTTYYKVLSSNKKFLKQYDFLDTTLATEYLKNNLNLLRENGFIVSCYKNIFITDSSIKTEIEIGDSYTWATIKRGNIPNLLFNNLGIDEGDFYNKALNYKYLANTLKKINTYFEDNGYPFSQINLDSVEIDSKNKVSAVLNLKKGELITIDSIDFGNDSLNIDPIIVEKIIGIKLGSVYNESQMRLISKRISESIVLEEVRPWRMYFNTQTSRLNLYLKEKNNNRADILLGLLPNNSEIGGKILLTGDVKLALVNSLRQAETIIINYQNLQYRSPRFNFEANIPYFSNLGLGINAKFNYYRKDTTFQTADYTIALQYNINSIQNFVKAFYNRASSKLININANQILQNLSLPSNIDYRTNTYGLNVQWSKLNNIYSPTKGFLINILSSLSLRNVIRNYAIESIYDPNNNRTLAYLYDSLTTNKIRYNVNAQAANYFSLRKLFALKIGINAGAMFNKTLFKNELYQIGGYRVLRGFDEGSLFVSEYYLATVEPRFLFSKNSFFFLFADYAKLKFPNLSPTKYYTAFGTGAGVNFQTRGGIFNMSLAIGNNLQNNIEFKNSKIHFGYVNVF